MSVCIDLYPWACDKCNYECNAKSDASLNMIKRLHKKKCQKIGRTEKISVYEEAERKHDIFTKNSVIPPRFVEGSDDSYTDEELTRAHENRLKKKPILDVGYFLD